MQKIKITCRGSGVLRLNEIAEFQGALKTLSAEASRKLKKSILAHGISFPFFLWKHGEKNLCLASERRLLKQWAKARRADRSRQTATVGMYGGTFMGSPERRSREIDGIGIAALTDGSESDNGQARLERKDLMRWERRIEFFPAFDKRDPDPNKNYGVH